MFEREAVGHSPNALPHCNGDEARQGDGNQKCGHVDLLLDKK
jgi:hypothetical protein